MGLSFINSDSLFRLFWESNTSISANCFPKNLVSLGSRCEYNELLNKHKKGIKRIHLIFL